MVTSSPTRKSLFSDAKEEATSGSNREGESTEAERRCGATHSSGEASVMEVERRERAIAIWLGSTGDGRNPMFKRKAAAFVRWHEPDESRGSRPDL